MDLMDSDVAAQIVRGHLLAGSQVRRRVAEEAADAVVEAAAAIAAALGAGSKVLLCGNGGSAADAQHIAAEFTNRLRPGTSRPALAALALTTDATFLTAHANDFGYATVFERQVEALGRPGDVLVAISTSGNSENVIRAVQACPALQITTVGLLGGDGGRLGPLTDLPVIVPSPDGQLVQEAHMAIGHVVCDLVERALFGPAGVMQGGLTRVEGWTTCRPK